MKKSLLLISLFTSFIFANAQVNTHSLSFDYVDDYVDVPNNAALNPTTSITIQAWIKANAWGTNVYDNYIVGKDDWATSSAGYALRAGAGGELSFNFAISGGVWQEVISSTMMSTGVWHNVAATFDGTTQKIYIDGVLAGTASYTGTIVTSTYDLNIGAVPYLIQGSRLFNGNIDQVMVWNTALTLAQINQYKNCPPTSAVAGLVGFWNLEEGTGTTTADQSGNALTATLMNGVAWSTTVQAFTCSGAGIAEMNVEAFSIYPNPSTGNATIVFNKPVNKGVVQLYNTLGEKCFEQNISSVSSIEINFTSISSGIYFLKINADNKQSVQKLIIQ